MAETFQVGQVLPLTMINSLTVDATVTHVDVCGDDDDRYLLVTYDIPGYGETQPYLYGGKTGTTPDDRIARSMIPSSLTNKTYDDFNWTLYGEDISYSKKIAEAFMFQYKTFEREGRGLYIYSKCKGSGKTYLACILANEIVREHNIPIRFINSTDYVELVKGKDEESASIINSLYSCRLLIIDDIGAQDDKQQWINESLFRLIDNRYREKRPVIFTSNCDIDDLGCDDRIVDRIDAMSIPVKMPEKRVRHIQASESTRSFLSKIMKTDDLPFN